MAKIMIVIRGLTNSKNVEKEVNSFFKKQGFGTVKKVHVVKTLPGRGGEGGRTDIVFRLTSPNVMKFGLSPFRFSSGSSWLDDYLNNDRDIIPSYDYDKLVKLE